MHTHTHTHTWTTSRFKGTQNFMSDTVSTTLQSFIDMNFLTFIPLIFCPSFEASSWLWLLGSYPLQVYDLRQQFYPPHPKLPPAAVRHNCAKMSTYVRHGRELGGWKTNAQLRRNIQVRSTFFVICENFCNPNFFLLDHSKLSVRWSPESVNRQL